jgi:hypothetical protein
MELPTLKEFLGQLKEVAKSQYSFAAYVVLVVGWMYVVVANHRLNKVSKLLKEVPLSERTSVLLREYQTVPKDGLSGEQFIRSRRHLYFLLGFIAILVVILVLSVIALTRSQGNVGETKETMIPRVDIKIESTPVQPIASQDWRRQDTEQCAPTTGSYKMTAGFLLIKKIDPVPGYSRIRIRVSTDGQVEIASARKDEPKTGREVQDEAGYPRARQWWIPLDGSELKVRLFVCTGTAAIGRELSSEDLKAYYDFEKDK